MTTELTSDLTTEVLPDPPTGRSRPEPVGRQRINEPIGADPIERLEAVCDPGSLRLLRANQDAGVVGGGGLVGGSAVQLFACDPRQAGGAIGELGAAVIVDTVERARRDGTPVIGIWQSGGARLQDGTSSLNGMGRIFRAIALASGTVPLVSVILGAAAGGAAYGPALTDFVVSGPGGRTFVTGPDVVRRVTGEDVDALSLGGPELHSLRSGVLHAAEETDRGALHYARRLVQLLADRTGRARQGTVGDRSPAEVVPSSPRQTYDMHTLIGRVLDPGETWVELHRRWAPNVITGFGRLGGRTVGVLANNPHQLAGCLDCAASEKAAAFVQKSDAFGIPLVVLADVPGYLPGLEQESGGVITRGARLLYAFARATVPRVTMIIRKAYGGAFIAMNSKSLGATAVYAWPTAEVGVMYPAGAIDILHRRRIAAAPADQREMLRARLAREYEQGAGGLNRALACGHVDAVIDPAESRRLLYAALFEGAETGNGR